MSPRALPLRRVSDWVLSLVAGAGCVGGGAVLLVSTLSGTTGTRIMVSGKTIYLTLAFLFSISYLAWTVRAWRSLGNQR